MKISIRPGKYIAAVSGGIDSMVLLDVLARQEGLELIVAHFDHGIRSDSIEDRRFVGQAAKKAGCKFIYETARLGARTSEEQARDARYGFLRETAATHHADAIITAHHQDDMLETALMNMLRGTGRKGLTSIVGNTEILRPLLHVSKAQIQHYAKTHELQWREDYTNEDTTYFRNYIRKKLMPKLSYAERQKLVEMLTSLHHTNMEIDKEIANYLQFQDKKEHILNKHLFMGLTHPLACEAMAEWLRKNEIRDFDKNLIERLVVAVKTYKAGQKADILKGRYLLVGKQTIEII